MRVDGLFQASGNCAVDRVAGFGTVDGDDGDVRFNDVEQDRIGHRPAAFPWTALGGMSHTAGIGESGAAQPMRGVSG